uniref:Uncharacterized protein n=1 Tax=Triticum urartu TaxID=4572 RepID=A0A8R7QV09_TRIUA
MCSFTLYTGPKPPCPNLFSSEKLFVAFDTSEKSKSLNSGLLPIPQTSSSSSCELSLPKFKRLNKPFMCLLTSPSQTMKQKNDASRSATVVMIKTFIIFRAGMFIVGSTAPDKVICCMG